MAKETFFFLLKLATFEDGIWSYLGMKGKDDGRMMEGESGVWMRFLGVGIRHENKKERLLIIVGEPEFKV